MRSQQPSDLPPVEAVESKPLDALPGFLTQLAALMAAGAIRLQAAPDVVVAPVPREEPDVWLDVTGVGTLLGCSKSWIRRHGRALPGLRQPSGKGGRVVWSRRALEEWMQSGGVLRQ